MCSALTHVGPRWQRRRQFCAAARNGARAVPSSDHSAVLQGPEAQFQHSYSANLQGPPDIVILPHAQQSICLLSAGHHPSLCKQQSERPGAITPHPASALLVKTSTADGAHISPASPAPQCNSLLDHLRSSFCELTAHQQDLRQALGHTNIPGHHEAGKCLTSINKESTPAPLVAPAAPLPVRGVAAQ